MKPIYFLSLLLTLLGGITHGQIKEEDLYVRGLRYLQGMGKEYNPTMAKVLFMKASYASDARAMVQLGNIYSAPFADKPNIDSALYWYNAALAAGSVNAYSALGRIYQFGIGVKQDFSAAVNYYSRGVFNNDLSCKYALAYLHYKGFGTTQDYKSAFELFREAAEGGVPNSMYFLGLCYRNGYGTKVSPEKSKYWLSKASEQNISGAIQELYGETTAETQTPNGSEKMKVFSETGEAFKASDRNNYEGAYKGIATYYDWSGKFVTETLPLSLNLVKTEDGYSGEWKEGEGYPATISMHVQSNRFSFSSRSKYLRNDRYSGRADEVWLFNSAKLDLSFVHDSVQLSGYVQFYSADRKEPGKPVFITLRRSIEIDSDKRSADLGLTLFPNPAKESSVVKFRLQTSGKVGIRVFSQNGVCVYEQTARRLPAGVYNFILPSQKFSPGSYNVQLTVNNVSESKLLIKL